MHNHRLSRRSFLRSSGAALAGSLAFPHLYTRGNMLEAAERPSESIRLGFIGVGNQGLNNLNSNIKRAVAVCDVDKDRLAAARARVEKNGQACAAFPDYRKLLEDKTIDAVVISSPDHWHALMAIDACAAGKDVYCEKPLTLTVLEGRAIVRAARRHKRIVQTGSQQRSSENFRRACELVRSGKLGKLQKVLVGIPGVNFKGPPVPDSEPPAELDYDQWLGPAPARPYNKLRVHYNFRFFWDYSGGQITNWGAHHWDIAHWGLGMDNSGPLTVEGAARFHEGKWFEVPTWFNVTCQYPGNITLVCGQEYKGGTTFVGEKGAIWVNRGKLESDPPEILKETLGEKDVRLYESKNHFQNWLDCIRTRKLPICDAEIGHRSATACHLGNLAIRTGRKLQWDAKAETIVGDAAAAQMLSRPYRAPWRIPQGYLT